MIWFSSDQHWGHESIITYCNRPFSSVEEMDREMIKRWNEVVKEGDIVYHLGDFTLGKDIFGYMCRLNGDIRIVTTLFHHDKRWMDTDDVTPYYWSPVVCENINGVWVFMFHYPVAVWDRKHYGSWHLYGHIHKKDFVLPGFTMNVGVDHHNFYPVSFDEVKRYMIGLGWTPEWREYEQKNP